MFDCHHNFYSIAVSLFRKKVLMIVHQFVFELSLDGIDVVGIDNHPKFAEISERFIEARRGKKVLFSWYLQIVHLLIGCVIIN